MPPIDLLSGDGKKLLLIGDSGVGKTGALAALIAVGYKLFMIDTDKGADILDGQIRSELSPYKSYMTAHNIKPFYSCVPFDIPMGLIEVTINGKKETLIGPTSGAAFMNIFRQLQDWKTPDGESYGNVSTWGPDCVLVLDTVSTLGQIAKTYSQFLNNHPGLLADEYGRDAGAARDLVTRLLHILMSTSLKCNVIVNAHVTRVDTSTGVSMNPSQRLQEKKLVNPKATASFEDAKGYPDVITRDFSTKVGKFFNNLFAAHEDYGKRFISTVPVKNITTKSAVLGLESSYPISTGLLEILCALRFQPPPEEFLSHFNGGSNQQNTVSSSSPRPAGWPGRS